jgi:hypothetical protein
MRFFVRGRLVFRDNREDESIAEGREKFNAGETTELLEELHIALDRLERPDFPP